MGQGGSGGTKSESNPWGPQQEYLRQIYSESQGQYPNEMPFYGGSTVAGRDPSTAAGLSGMESIARGGAPGSDAAYGLAQREVGGEFLNANPYLDSMYDRAAQAVSRNYNQTIRPGIESSFASSNRMGSGAYMAARREGERGLGEGLSNMAVDIYGGNYDSERARMGAASDRMAGLEQGRYAASDRLAGVGSERERYEQQLIDAARERYEYGQQEPWQRLGLYSNAIGAPVMSSKLHTTGQGMGSALLAGI